MDRIEIDLKHCYGIKSLKQTFDFSTGRAKALYAPNGVMKSWCLRCLLLVMCTYPFAKKALTLYLARSEDHERYFGCNLMQCKVLASSHQHLIAEAPERALAILRRSVRSTDFVGLPRTSLVSIRDSSRDYGYTQPERAPGGRAVPGRTLRPQDHTDL